MVGDGKHYCICVTAQRTALIVYAHQSAASFNAAVRDVAVQELREQGYKVIVSDLYGMNFKAGATEDDIIGEYFRPQQHWVSGQNLVFQGCVFKICWPVELCHRLTI